jgi:hypothetical protein
LGWLCARGHATPVIRIKKPPRCEGCGCRRLGHATGCGNFCEGALDQATQWAEDGDFEESAMWLEVLIVNNYFTKEK